MEKEPYNLSFDEIGNLTYMQIRHIIMRPRDKNGIPLKMEYPFATKEEKLNQYKHTFYAMGRSLGKSDEELNKQWSSIENGS